MKKSLVIFALLSITILKSYSQIIFENGYFIDDTNQKVECVIKNIDWENNPTEFEYMLSQNANIQKASIRTAKEFGINGVSKYIRTTVKIDRSSDDLNYMSSERNPKFMEEQLFLKVLVEGKASLLLYKNNNLTRFFFKTNDSITSQLVYRQYLIENKIAQNNYFRQQLFIDLKCQTITTKDVKNINYNKRDLERFLVKYNECTNSTYINYKSLQKKDLFNLSFRPGLNSSNLTIQNSLSGSGTDFGNKFGLRFGIEAEFILPYNKNKWSIIIEPTYQYYESEKTKEANYFSGGIQISKVNYHSIELPVGLRHYFYLNNDSKIFANVSYVFDFSSNSSMEFSRADGSILNSLEIESRRNAALGIGYKYMDRFSMEIRYQTGREILSDYSYWDSSYNTLSLIFGYSIF